MTKQKNILGKTLIKTHTILTQTFLFFSFVDLKSVLKMVLREGGEGVMLRKLGSAYQNGRSHFIFKFKELMDGEALIKDIDGIEYTCELYVFRCPLLSFVLCCVLY